MYKVFNRVWLGGILEFTLILVCWIGGCTLLFRYNLGASDFYVLDDFRIVGIVCSLACSCFHIFMWYYIGHTRLKSILDLADLRVTHLSFSLLLLLTTSGMLLFENSTVNTFVYWWIGIAYTLVCSAWELFWIVHKKKELPRQLIIL